jgi:citrate lyase subunit beta/citryl-CoA lyase
MTLRSMLFVPGDSERKLAKAASCPADALILDLEDSVPAARTAIARTMVLEYLRARPTRQALWVRINALSSASALPDLVAVVPGAPDGIVLPKPDSAADAILLDHYLSALEAREGLPLGRIGIIPIATETAPALFALQTYAGSTARLAGLTWGGEDLATVLGASANHDAQGNFTSTFALARSLCLLAAAAANVQALDSVYTDFRDTAGLRREAQAARRDGYSGKIAIHPDQVPVINEVFTPSAQEIEHAQRVVELFASGAGALSLDGKMLDMPHLKLARQTLERAGIKPGKAD